MRIDELDQAIKAVCPIDGISFGKLDDPSTWSIQYNPNNLPTQEQTQAALDIIAVVPSVEVLVVQDNVQIKLDELQAKLTALETKVDSQIAK